MLPSGVRSPSRTQAAGVPVVQGQEGPRTLFAGCGGVSGFGQIGGGVGRGIKAGPKTWPAAPSSQCLVPEFVCLEGRSGPNSMPTRIPSPYLSYPTLLSVAMPAQTAPRTTPISGEFPGPEEGQPANLIEEGAGLGGGARGWGVGS